MALLLIKLGLGASCLADDMGGSVINKTIQVISLLLVLKQNGGPRQQPKQSLGVAPVEGVERRRRGFKK